MAYYNLLFLLSQLLCAITAQYVGSSCGNGSGVCKVVTDCPHMLERIKRGERYDRCGFRDFAEVICCPSATEATTRISEQKCIEYGRSVFKTEWVIMLNSENGLKKVTMDLCGHNTQNQMTALDVQINQYPHMALIGFNSDETNTAKWLCSGSLISEQYILTSAHCARSEKSGDANFVRLGDHYFNSRGDSAAEYFNVTEIFIHPNFTLGSRYNDIALLKLNRRVIFNRNQRPACLPYADSLTKNIDRFATGWKLSNEIEENRLQRKSFQQTDHEECSYTSTGLKYGSKLPYGVENETQECFVPTDIHIEKCLSGVIQSFDPKIYCMFNIHAISVFNPDECDEIDVPNVYNKVSPYLEWIETKVWKS